MSVRLKATKNIEKITKTMKMVSTAKYQRALRELKSARAYGSGALGKEWLQIRARLLLMYRSSSCDVDLLYSTV